MITCPYPDCQAQFETGLDRCPACQRQAKYCANCHQASRPFAQFCRNCGRNLPDDPANWDAFPGDGRNYGEYVHEKFSGAHLDRDGGVQQAGEIRMKSPVRALLIHEGYLFIFAHDGNFVVSRLGEEGVGAPVARGSLLGELTATPVISGGSLYTGSRNAIQAFTLGKLSLANARLEERWRIPPPSGYQVHSLMPQGEFLFCRFVQLRTQAASIWAVRRIQDVNPETIREAIHPGPNVGSMAADAARAPGRIYYFSNENGTPVLNTIMQEGRSLRPIRSAVYHAPSPVQCSQPIAANGDKLFAVFEQNKSLCQVDALDPSNTSMIRQITKHVNYFSLADGGVPAAATLNGLYIPRFENVIPLEADDLNLCLAPIALWGMVYALGLSGGRVRFLDRHERSLVWTMDAPQARVETIAPYHDLIIAGTSLGTVRAGRIHFIR